MDNQLDQIIQTPDSIVEVTFAPNRVSRMSISARVPETSSHLPYKVSMPLSIRNSVSNEIPWKLE